MKIARTLALYSLSSQLRTRWLGSPWLFLNIKMKLKTQPKAAYEIAEDSIGDLDVWLHSVGLP